MKKTDTRVRSIGFSYDSFSFPNTGGMIVSNHTLTAIFLIPKDRNLGKKLGDTIYI
jgi:hypothetical protein